MLIYVLCMVSHRSVALVLEAGVVGIVCRLRRGVWYL